mgnify:CR=1 FL=1
MIINTTEQGGGGLRLGYVLDLDPSMLGGQSGFTWVFISCLN